MQKKIFISYSWDSPKHKVWVKKFSDDLQAGLGDSFEVLLDQNQKRGTSLSRFMKQGLRDANKVLIIGTPKYKEKSETSGGVAYETMVITNEMMTDMGTTKFCPILRSGTFKDSFPTDIKDRKGDDFSNDSNYNDNLKDLIKALIEELSPLVVTTSDDKDQAMAKRGLDNKLVCHEAKKKQLDDNLIFSVGNVSFKMIRVESGSFIMGATDQDKDANNSEKPSHQVTLSSYYIGETVVTQELWQLVMGNNPSPFKGVKRPVESISWEDVQNFIRKLNDNTKSNFRLPTEAEWEFAARGGNKSKGYKYSGSNTLDDVAWYEDNSSNRTHNVAQKKANELGIYDMSGNILELCCDWFGSYNSTIQTNSKGPQNGIFRVLRGGSWFYEPWFCRVSCRRSHNFDNDNHFYFGIRLVLSE